MQIFHCGIGAWPGKTKADRPAADLDSWGENPVDRFNS